MHIILLIMSHYTSKIKHLAINKFEIIFLFVNNGSVYLIL